MSLNINVASVESVLLADGWHRVLKGTFLVDAYEYFDNGDLVLGGGRVQGVPSTGAAWTESEDGTTVACPATAILAVKWKAESGPGAKKPQTQRYAEPAATRGLGSLSE